jgi:hypothetical protein
MVVAVEESRLFVRAASRCVTSTRWQNYSSKTAD